MQRLFYEIIALLSKKTRPWLADIIVWIVTTGFFIASPKRVRVSIRFYKELFPDRGRSYGLWCAWRQYHHFSHVFLDRLWLQDSSGVTYTSEGWEHLEDAYQKGGGGIILMSHLGNWEAAAHLLKKKNPEMKLLLYMGVKQKEQIEHIQKQGLSAGGIKIAGVDQSGGSPLDIIEAIRMLKEGGFVSMTGDVLWSSKQRAASVRFLRHQVNLPEAPHILALLSGAPLFILFAFRGGRRNYHFKIVGPEYVRSASRSQRAEVILKSVQAYARLLEAALYQSPLEWYHFEPFLGPRLHDHTS